MRAQRKALSIRRRVGAGGEIDGPFPPNAGLVNEFSHMSDEELEAFIWDGVAVLRGGANRE